MVPRRSKQLVIACLCLAIVALAVAGYRKESLKYPVCALIQWRPGHELKGLDQADVVYEWRGLDGDPVMLAVFTRSFAGEVGPLGVLGVGAADIACTYGRVVCGFVLPEVAQYFGPGKVDVMIDQDSRPYVSIQEISDHLAQERVQILPSQGYRLPTGRGGVGAEPASEVTITDLGGGEESLWRWDGARYVRDIGGTQVTASAVVILETGGGFLDSGEFPDGFLAGEGFSASIFAGGCRENVTWVRKGLPSVPIAFEYPAVSGVERLVRFPRGRVWIHVVSGGDLR